MNSSQPTSQQEPPSSATFSTNRIALVICVLTGITIVLGLIFIPRYFSPPTPDPRAGVVACESLAIIHKHQLAYKDGVGKGKFGSATELFYNDIMQDGALAAAAGVPQNVVSKNGSYVTQGNPMLNGYTYSITAIEPTGDQPARYTALAIAGKDSRGVPYGKIFYVDQTGVVRGSDKLDVTPDQNSAPIE